MARRGYRFIAPVQRFDPDETHPTGTRNADLATSEAPLTSAQAPEIPPDSEPKIVSRILAHRKSFPGPHRVVQSLFVLLQLMYVAFYVAGSPIWPRLKTSSHRCQSRLTLNVSSSRPQSSFPSGLHTQCCAATRPTPAAISLKSGLSPRHGRDLGSLALSASAPHHYGLAIACTTLLVYAPSPALLGPHGAAANPTNQHNLYL